MWESQTPIYGKGSPSLLTLDQINQLPRQAPLNMSKFVIQRAPLDRGKTPLPSLLGDIWNMDASALATRPRPLEVLFLIFQAFMDWH